MISRNVSETVEGMFFCGHGGRSYVAVTIWQSGSLAVWQVWLLCLGMNGSFLLLCQTCGNLAPSSRLLAPVLCITVYHDQNDGSCAGFSGGCVGFHHSIALRMSSLVSLASFHGPDTLLMTLTISVT